MKKTRWTLVGMIVAAGLVVGNTSARADVYLPHGNSQSSVPTIKSADDAVAQVPILKKIPTSFLFGDGFRFKLTGMELRIDHMGTHSAAPVSKRDCMIGLSYEAPVAFFGTRMELPILHAENLKVSDWGFNTPGDYVMHFSKDAAVAHPVISLSATLRF
jgi:hypothetical protein